MLRSGIMLAVALSSLAGTAVADVSVTTYHNDNMRTGWNSNETILAPSNVAGSSFKLLRTVKLDEQVDAQPLFVTDVKIAGRARDVVYVVTENNSVYGLDGTSGKVLLQRNLGTPVPEDDLPGGCNNNAPNIGIDSTPVVDRSAGILYLVSDRLNGQANAIYHIHALSLSTLKDVVAPRMVSASGKLSNGDSYHFNANVSRLRAALLLSKGNIYAGFASYCDVSADQSRGWILGWNATTLKPLAANDLTNTLASSTDNFFLTSIWMSGYGLAANGHGDVFFVTGNSDPSGDSFNAVENITESAASLSSDLSTMNSVFTPSDWSDLDQGDTDFGSGGLMLLPPQNNTSVRLAVAAGKDGNLYLLNADNLSHSFGSPNIGGCWCGQSYFTSSDGNGRVVTSGGTNVGVWSVHGGTSPSLVQLNQSSDSVDNGQDPGFFTSVSSNGTKKNTQVIWAVGRPDDAEAHIKLYAFNDKTDLLFSANAGHWPNTGGNANIVPTVANGHVYVASNKMLAIFGLGGGKAAEIPAIASVPYRTKLAPGMHEVFGKIRDVNGAIITIAARDGKMVTVDASDAIRKFNYAAPKVGRAMMARGVYEPSGTMRAEYVMHAKPNPAIWLSDR
jgi:hypothetical protein